MPSLIKKFMERVAGRKQHRTPNDGPILSTVGLCMVRNEQDLIEPFLRHNAGLLDLLVVLDNRSADATRSIAVATARDLGNVIIADLPDLAYNQASTMSRMLRFVQSAVFADYVLFLDADEFLPVRDRADLMSRLAGIPPGGCGLLPWKTCLPDPQISETDCPEPLNRMTLCRKTEAPQYYKAALRLAGALNPDLSVGQGNHAILDDKGKALPSVILPDLPLLHFPLRSVDQLLAKGVVGWKANQNRGKAERAKGKKRGEAYQWKRLHDIALAGERVDAARLTQEALDYAQDQQGVPLSDGALPFDHGIAAFRHHSDGSFMAADQLIASIEAEVGPTPFVLPAPPGNRGTGPQVPNAFDGSWHWDNLFLDEPFIRAVIDLLAPQSILDLGCGSGVYPLLYRYLGASDVLGVDGIEPEATVLDAAHYVKADLQQPFDAGRRFDLVVCLEVLEHLQPEATSVMLDTIARHVKDGACILFSMAEPGQPGHGHINCKTMSQVLDLWAERGWFPDGNLTLGLRAVASMSWFGRNTLLLRRREEAGASARLKRIGQMPFVWYGQGPGHRKAAFKEAYPAPGTGYGRR